MSEDIRRARIEKLKKLRDLGIIPYADKFKCSHTLLEAIALPDGEPVRVAGRMITKRSFGKLIFAHLFDRSGRAQVSFQENKLSEEQFKMVKTLVDIGDFIGIEGEQWTTKRGERTIGSKSITFLSKSLRGLPEKWHGLQDKELCYRQRYLDLITNENTRKRFILRSKIISYIRKFLDEHDFIEVETPILQAAASGAAARPFITYHNFLKSNLYLRISPETYLKRLVVGGFERVYELSRNFRNEDVDPSHLPEFTMLEWYAAYWNFRDNMKFIQELIQSILLKFLNTTKIEYRGITLDFGGNWPEISYIDAVKKETKIDLRKYKTYDELADAIRKYKPEINPDEYKSHPALIDGLYKKTVRPKLIQPTFLTYHPSELVPLARRNDENPGILNMFQVVVNTWEIVKAYSELIDPLEQYQRMIQQQKYREKGDDETMMMEKDYIECMEYGMPPNSGLGLGIDRITAIITNSESLRDVILFPTLKIDKP
ncbi:MAG: lysine--tRNA ligase [Candidatus Helarchaeota archaeon]